MLKPMPAALMGATFGIVVGSLATVLLSRPLPTARADRAPGTVSSGPPVARLAPRDRAGLQGDRPVIGEPAPAVPRVGDVAEKDNEIKTLRAKLAEREQALATLREQVADEQAQREALEGKPVDWPGDLDARFREEALHRQVTAALAEANLTGQVTEIDCNEYPCIVYGRIDDHDGRGLDVLSKTPAMKPYLDGANSTSAWGGLKKRADGERKEAVFGMALYPKERDPERQAQVEKRLRLRHQAFWEQARADEAP